MKIYMDVCCWNRPFDDQSQKRICIEANAILAILEQCKNGECTLTGSELIELELGNCPNIEKREKTQELYSATQGRLALTLEVEARALELQAGGMKKFDSLHVALAEIYRQDVFLTTDDALLAVARRIGTTVKVMNPIFLYMEAEKYGDAPG